MILRYINIVLAKEPHGRIRKELDEPMPGSKRSRDNNACGSCKQPPAGDAQSEEEKGAPPPTEAEAEAAGEPPARGGMQHRSVRRRIDNKVIAAAAATTTFLGECGDGGADGSSSQPRAGQGKGRGTGAEDGGAVGGGGATAAAGGGGGGQPGGSGSDDSCSVSPPDPPTLPELFLLTYVRSRVFRGTLALRRLFPREAEDFSRGVARAATVNLFHGVGAEQQRYDVTLTTNSVATLYLSSVCALRDDLGRLRCRALQDGDPIYVAAMPDGRRLIVDCTPPAPGYCVRVRLTEADLSPRRTVYIPLFQMGALLGPQTANRPGQSFPVHIDPRVMAQGAAGGSSELAGAKLVRRSNHVKWEAIHMKKWLQQWQAKEGDFLRLWVEWGEATAAQQQQQGEREGEEGGRQQQPQGEGEGQQHPKPIIRFHFELAADAVPSQGPQLQQQPPQQPQQHPGGVAWRRLLRSIQAKLRTQPAANVAAAAANGGSKAASPVVASAAGAVAAAAANAAAAAPAGAAAATTAAAQQAVDIAPGPQPAAGPPGQLLSAGVERDSSARTDLQVSAGGDGVAAAAAGPNSASAGAGAANTAAGNPLEQPPPPGSRERHGEAAAAGRAGRRRVHFQDCNLVAGGGSQLPPLIDLADSDDDGAGQQQQQQGQQRQQRQQRQPLPQQQQGGACVATTAVATALAGVDVGVGARVGLFNTVDSDRGDVTPGGQQQQRQDDEQQEQRRSQWQPPTTKLKIKPGPQEEPRGGVAPSGTGAALQPTPSQPPPSPQLVQHLQPPPPQMPPPLAQHPSAPLASSAQPPSVPPPSSDPAQSAAPTPSAQPPVDPQPSVQPEQQHQQRQPPSAPAEVPAAATIRHLHGCVPHPPGPQPPDPLVEEQVAGVKYLAGSGVRQAMEQWAAAQTKPLHDLTPALHQMSIPLPPEGVGAGVSAGGSGSDVAPQPWISAFRRHGLNTTAICVDLAVKLGLGRRQCWGAPLPRGPVEAQGVEVRQDGRGRGLGLFATHSFRANNVICVPGGLAMAQQPDGSNFQLKGYGSLPDEVRQQLQQRAAGSSAPSDSDEMPFWAFLAGSFRMPFPGHEGGRAGRPGLPPLELQMLGHGGLAAYVNDPRVGAWAPGAEEQEQGQMEQGQRQVEKANCLVVPVLIRGAPVPVLVALRSIAPEDQLLREYGDGWWADMAGWFATLESYGVSADAVLHGTGAAAAEEAVACAVDAAGPAGGPLSSSSSSGGAAGGCALGGAGSAR